MDLILDRHVGFGLFMTKPSEMAIIVAVSNATVEINRTLKNEPSNSGTRIHVPFPKWISGALKARNMRAELHVISHRTPQMSTMTLEPGYAGMDLTRRRNNQALHGTIRTPRSWVARSSWLLAHDVGGITRGYIFVKWDSQRRDATYWQPRKLGWPLPTIWA